MTEISTNKINSIKQNGTASEDVDFAEDLDAPEQQFYVSIKSKLTLLQLAPKEETVVKIMHYSQNYK